MAGKGSYDITALLGKQVSNLDTAGREQIEYIDIGLLDADPNNFYEISGVEELASNIQVVGLQQPIRVRAGEDGRFTITSGHRRKAALSQLVEEGLTQYRQVPCIRERSDGSAALRELRLIFANSDTRRMSSADISRQAERVELLLYQLKEEGYEFPGRMRDHVAEACKVSKTKLANLKTIRENLIPAWKELWEQNAVNESLALTIARMPEEHQQMCHENRGVLIGKPYGCYYESNAKADGERLAKLDELKCPRTGGPCENRARKWERLRSVSTWSFEHCSKTCCDNCSDLASCTKACAHFEDKIKALKAERREERRQEKLAKEEEDRPVISEIMKYWGRFGEARKAAGKSVRECYQALRILWSESDDKAVSDLESLKAKYTRETALPYGYNCTLTSVQRYVRIADLLGCSLDYLLCRTDDPRGMGGKAGAAAEAPAEGWVPLRYLPGTEKPARDGQLAVGRFSVPGIEKPMRTIARWQNGFWRFPSGARLEAKCVSWFPLPEEEANAND